MARATSISLSKFTASVQAAVRGAVQRHPKFRLDAPQGIAVSYLIRGIPVPDALLAQVTLPEMQGFADDVAAHIAGQHPEAFAAAGTAPRGAIISIGGHVILGIPPIVENFTLEK